MQAVHTTERRKSKVLLVAAPATGVAQPTATEIQMWAAYLKLRICHGTYPVSPESLPLVGNAMNQNDGLLHLGGILRSRGHEVSYLASHVGCTDEELFDAVTHTAKEVDLVGFYAHSCGVPFVERSCRSIKETNPAATTVLGGPHATGLSEEMLGKSPIDVLVRGRAHRSLPWLVETRANGMRCLSDSDVPPGYFAEPPPLFLAPDYSLLNVEQLPFARVYTTLGCGKAQPCVFCSSLVDHQRFSHGDVEAIVSQLEHLVEKRGTEFLYIGDEDFFRHPKHAARFHAALTGRFGSSLKFVVQAHVESVNRHTWLVDELAEFGACLEIQVGAESAHPDILDASNKGLRAELIEHVGRLVKGKGMRYYANWLSWLPGETPDTHRYTTERIIGMLKQEFLDYAESYIVNPYPGTGMFRRREELGIEILDWDFGRWRGENVPPWRYFKGPAPEVMHELHMERVSLMRDVYESRLADVSVEEEACLGFDPMKVLSLF